MPLFGCVGSFRGDPTPMPGQDEAIRTVWAAFGGNKPLPADMTILWVRGDDLDCGDLFRGDPVEPMGWMSNKDGGLSASFYEPKCIIGDTTKPDFLVQQAGYIVQIADVKVGESNFVSSTLEVGGFGTDHPLVHEFCHVWSNENTGSPDSDHKGPCFTADGKVTKARQALLDVGL